MAAKRNQRSGKAPAKPAAEQQEKRQRNVRRVRPTTGDRISGYFNRQLETLGSAFGKLMRHPFGTLLTALVIGVTLSLPTGMYAALKNVSAITENWEGNIKVSVYLKMKVSDDAASVLRRKLEAMDEIERVRLITRDGAQVIMEDQGFGQAMKLLNFNPLPIALEILPKEITPDEAAALVSHIEKMSQVKVVKVDKQWLERLQYIESMLEKGAIILACLLVIGVLIIIGNTIRLDIRNQSDEIEVIKMVGGTDSFIRQPFLYTGLWYGVFGAILAWVIVLTIAYFMGSAAADLAKTYSQNYRILTLSFFEVLALVGAGGLLGWFGSLISVNRELKHIEPGDRFA